MIVRSVLRFITGALCVGFAGMAHGDEMAPLIASPFSSLAKTRQLLDAADLRIMLPLGFSLRRGATGGALTSRIGVVESRVYAHLAGGRSVEVAIVEAPVAGYEFALYGPAEDLPDISRRFRVLADRGKAAKLRVELGYEMLRLGHMEADRALSLLKALGYSTIEFAESAKSQAGRGIFDLIRERTLPLPWVINVINATKTSLLEEAPAGVRGRTLTSTRTTTSSSAAKTKGAPGLGGSHLHSTTGGSPQERLLLVYDRNEPEALEKLINLIQTQIDVAAQQIVMEALVVEINTSELRNLGVEFRGATEHVQGTFERTSNTGSSLGTFLFSRDSFTDFVSFRASLEALEESGNAEVLSSPSVLVLNDRQARIQVGRQIPVARTTATTATVTKGIEYFPIGIVLNLRPRINPQGSEVTLQIETIISSISPESAALVESGADKGVEFSPIIDNRLVETYVRVADGTPFIIGGLLSTNEQETRVGVPVLATIPFLGRLFSRELVEKERREVIVVITPHIVPQEESSFSYLIPKDSGIFDRFDYQLFRNAYRVRDEDVWDLKFIQESQVLRDLVHRVAQHAEADVMLQRREPFRTLLAGDIPGEEVLVRRMLGEIVDKLDYTGEVDLEKVFFFAVPDGAGEGQYLEDRGLADLLSPVLATPDRAVLLSFEAQSTPSGDSPFVYPVATVIDTVVPTGERELIKFVRRVNPNDDLGRPLRWTLVLADQSDVKHLKQVLVLKRLLELNEKLPLTLQAFQPGLQILFPTRDDMRRRYHLIGSEVAQLFYETSSSQYYPAFERVFNRIVQEIGDPMGRRR